MVTKPLRCARCAARSGVSPRRRRCVDQLAVSAAADGGMRLPVRLTASIARRSRRAGEATQAASSIRTDLGVSAASAYQYSANEILARGAAAAAADGHAGQPWPREPCAVSSGLSTGSTRRTSGCVRNASWHEDHSLSTITMSSAPPAARRPRPAATTMAAVRQLFAMESFDIVGVGDGAQHAAYHGTYPKTRLPKYRHRRET